MGVKNDSTLVFNKYRVIFDPPLDGVGLKSGLQPKSYSTRVEKIRLQLEWGYNPLNQPGWKIFGLQPRSNPKNRFFLFLHF